MQLMTWTLARLGSRFNLLFEPHRRRVMHSAVGRFLDQPLDLMVGLVEPDGTERVLPFSQQGELLHNCEQFERFNSITYRGYSARYRLRFELNIHSVFYPQDEMLCIMPAFYMEMRLNPAPKVRWIKPSGEEVDKVRLFIRVKRPATQISACGCPNSPCSACINLDYEASLKPELMLPDMVRSAATAERSVAVKERIRSLNPGVDVDEDGQGMSLELPVTEIGSGIKWRLVWGAHVAEPVLHIGDRDNPEPATFRYAQHWPDIDAVMEDAVRTRDDRLAHSRRFEKLIHQAPLNYAQRHLIHQTFQSFLSNTWWCDLPDGSEWFSVWEGSCYYQSTIDVEYNVALFYLALWPRLLALQLRQWPRGEKTHDPSNGGYLSHDLGQGVEVTGQRYPHEMEVEENCNYLLLLQAYAHWTGDMKLPRELGDVIERLGNYLAWADRDESGFPSEGTANTLDDASPASQVAKKQTYLAVKRLAALQAAGDLLHRLDRDDKAFTFEEIVKNDIEKIEQAAWIGDHYAVCADKDATGLIDPWTNKPYPFAELPGWDAYSIYTGNGLLLPMMIDQPTLLKEDRLKADVYAAFRESASPYGCGHSSYEGENVWISQNLWRDCLASYLGLTWAPLLHPRYWDMQTMSNTGQQSYGFIDTYIGNTLCFYPRGITSIGMFMAQPRLVIDRLAPGQPRITVNPDRSLPQRWPLLPLADWRAGKIPVCVVDPQGNITIEGENETINIVGEDEQTEEVIG